MSSKSASPISPSGSPIHVDLVGPAGGAAGLVGPAEILESGFDTFHGVNPTYPLPLYLYTIGFGNSYIDYESLEDINTFEGKTIEQLIAIAENNRNSKPLKDKQTIINAYFAETDEDRSYYLLRCLLFTPFTEGSMRKWLDAYIKSSPENRLEMLPKILYTSKFI